MPSVWGDNNVIKNNLIIDTWTTKPAVGNHTADGAITSANTKGFGAIYGAIGGSGLPKSLGGSANNTQIMDDNYVLSARDYKADTIKNMKTGEVTTTGLPSSNVIYYDLSEDAWLCVRPSGTEPKVKFYYGVKGTSLEDAQKLSKELGEEVLAMTDKMM